PTITAFCCNGTLLWSCAASRVQPTRSRNTLAKYLFIHFSVNQLKGRPEKSIVLARNSPPLRLEHVLAKDPLLRYSRRVITRRAGPRPHLDQSQFRPPIES